MFVWVLILVGWVAFLSLILHDVTKQDATGSAVLAGARKVRALFALAVVRFRRFRRARARALARARAEQQAAKEAVAAAASAASPAETGPPNPVSAAPMPQAPISPEPVSVEPAPAELTPAEPMFAEPMPAETPSPEIAPSTPMVSEEPSPPEEPSQAETLQPETPQQVAPEAIKLAPEAVEVQTETAEASSPKKKWWRPHDDRAAKTIPEIETAITRAVQSATPDCKDFVGVIVRPKTPKSRHDVNWELQGVRFGKADKKLVNDALRGIVKQMQREYRVPDR
jgi:hypothetical protein